jgi:hypothetical protein
MRFVALASALLMFTSDKPTSLKADLVLVTRADCVTTPDMIFNTEDALKALGWPQDFHSIDISTLPKTDERTGYPTPTLLWKGKDIFGMPVPKPPYGGPT